MRSIHPQGTGVAVASAVTTLPFPPVTSAYVDHWNKDDMSVPEFQLEMWAASTVALTAAELYAGVLHPLVYADNTLTTFTHATDIITENSHGLLHGDGPFRLSNSGGAVPTGLSETTDYWIIYLTDDTFQLAASLQDAIAATPVPVLFSSAGTGTTSLVDTTDTKRLHWHSLGNLGKLADGAVSLGAQLAYTVRGSHYSNVVAYAVSATLGGAVATSAQIYPVQER